MSKRVSVRNFVAKNAGINRGGAHRSAKDFSRVHVTVNDALEEYFMDELDYSCILQDEIEAKEFENWEEYQAEEADLPPPLDIFYSRVTYVFSWI